MKNTIFLFITLITTCHCFSQILSGHYIQCRSFFYKPSEFQIDLYFFEQGTYMIEIREQQNVLQDDSILTANLESYEIDDYEYVVVLSNGFFKIDSNKLLLTDAIENYTMVLKIDQDRLIADKSFGFMNGLVFCFSDTISECRITEKFKNTDNFITEIECETYNAEHSNQNKLNYGVYGCKYDLLSNTLNYRINADSTFVITYKRKIISEGKWIRKNNILILTDKDLLYPFYLLIGNDFLLKKQGGRYIKIPWIYEA